MLVKQLLEYIQILPKAQQNKTLRNEIFAQIVEVPDAIFNFKIIFTLYF